MITAHEYRLRVNGTDIAITEDSAGDVTLDESWSPYVQAKITIPLPSADVIAALDPRKGARATLTLAARWGVPVPVAVATARWAGLALSALTTQYAGAQLRQITADFAPPLNDFGLRDSTILDLNLGVRERVINRDAGTLTLDLASDEAIAQDTARVATTSVSPGLTVRDAVALALASIGATLQPGTATGVITADAAAWQPGVTAWDYVAPLVEAAGLRLWCDGQRRWWLTTPLSAADVALVVTDQELHDLEEVLSRETWVDGVVVTYRWTDSAGVGHVQYDVAGGTSSVLVVERTSPYPGPGAAASLLGRSRARGTAQTATVMSAYDVEPGWVFEANMLDEPIQVGIVSAVTWSLSDDTMRVRSRDLADTPITAWVLQPAGYRWTDIPASVPWTAYTNPEA